MIDPIEDTKVLGRVFLGILAAILLYLLVGWANLLLHNYEEKKQQNLQQQVSNYQQELAALKSQNEELQKTVEAQKNEYEAQVKTITDNSKQIYDQKTQEKQQVETISQKQTTHHAAIAKTTIQTTDTIQLNKKEIDSLSSDNIQAINDAYLKCYPSAPAFRPGIQA